MGFEGPKFETTNIEALRANVKLREQELEQARANAKGAHDALFNGTINETGLDIAYRGEANAERALDEAREKLEAAEKGNN